MERGEAIPGEDSGGREGRGLAESEGVERIRHRVDGRIKTRDGRGGAACVWEIPGGGPAAATI